MDPHSWDVMEEAQRTKYVRQLQKVERKHQMLGHVSHKLKNKKLTSLMWDMESQLRLLIRRLEAGDIIPEGEVQKAIKGIAKYEVKIQGQLTEEKELDRLAGEVEKMWSVYKSIKDDVPETYTDFHTEGVLLQRLFRSISDRSIRKVKVIRDRLSAFDEAVMAVERTL